MRYHRLLGYGVGFIVGSVLILGCENTSKLREAELMKKSEKYEDAIARYKLFLSENPQTSKQDEVNNSIADCYIKWGQTNHRIKKYELAVQNFETVASEYRSTPSYSDANRFLPSSYLELGKSYIDDGKLVEGGQALRTVVERFRGNPLVKDAEYELSNIGVIAFGAQGSVWIMNADGTNPTKVADKGIHADMGKDGKTLTYIKPVSSSSDEGHLLVMDITTRKETSLVQTPNASFPVLSPDSQYIAVRKGKYFQTINYQEDITNTYKGMIKMMTRVGDWSVEEAKVAGYVHESGKLPIRVSIFEGNFESYYVLASPPKPIRALAWSPDGRSIAYLTEDGIYIISASGGEPNPFLLSNEVGLDIRALDMSPDGKNMILIAKSADDVGYRFYLVNLKKDLKPIAVTFPEPLELDLERVSWGRGAI